ncbi:FCD domain-containing protein [Steroidobacter flavus]|uniref:FCD domain-containing protein n=1 Tax=Steroidobacter flavus TaxID=1842136 RepID=A0ABV8T0K9_9GAMM
MSSAKSAAAPKPASKAAPRAGKKKLPVKKSRDVLQGRLARQILQHMRDAGLSIGDPLTERTLAKQFGVSRSPVRNALKLLTEQQLIKFEPATGYQVALANSELEARLADVPDTAADTLYMTILRDRFADRIDRQIGESEIKRRYNVSSGLLMDVLLRMFDEGLIRRSQGHGWLFTPMVNTVEGYRASYEFRLALEPSAMQSSRYKVDPVQFERLYAEQMKLLKGDMGDLTGREFFEYNTRFHETLVEFSQNEFLLQAIRQHNQLRRVVEYESFYQRARVADSAREHLAVLDALKKGDLEWAATLMRRHLQVAGETLSAFRGGEAGPTAKA